MNNSIDHEFSPREKISLQQWVEISSTHCEDEKSETIQ